MDAVRIKRFRALVFTLVAVATAASAETVYYVAPAANAAGSGASEAAPALYTRNNLWKQVRRDLKKQPVTVRFLVGQYIDGPLNLIDIGHPAHRLVLEGDPSGKSRLMAINMDGTPSSGLFLNNAQNITVRHLSFTGPGTQDYLTHVQGRYIAFENCAWTGLNAIKYGAAGASGNQTHHVLYRNCTFARNGLHPGAHMINNAHGPQHIYIIDCTFEDCGGDYVRFRDRVDYCVVQGCTFRSSGMWPGAKPIHACFISIPVFGQSNPGNESFGTHFLFKNNAFVYAGRQAAGPQVPIIFLHSGYDPQGRHHLMTRQEGDILEHGPPAERKALLKRNCNLDMDEVHVFNNTSKNVIIEAAFSSRPAFGAESKGWAEEAPVFDLFNHTPEDPDWFVEGKQQP